MLPEIPDDATVCTGIEIGVELALRAKDSGDWKPVFAWLIQNPEQANELADFLASERHVVDLTQAQPATMVRVGSMIAHLELLEEIGHGGMGIVYRAADNLKREVAVKLLRFGDHNSKTEAARFRFEAEMVASLDHPNIVKILAFGEVQGSPYLVMPLMTGGSLAGWLKARNAEHGIDSITAATLVCQIALGVQHARQRGLIHRDLKPGNILLDQNRTPHIADFGLARPLDMTASMAGRIVGTILYMAPEQARGEIGLTTAVDIHALGAILFELLTGRPPFIGGDMASVIRRGIEEPAPSVRALRPDTDPDIAAICMKCLHKEPSDRYSSAAALADDLTKFLKGEPISMPQTGWLRTTIRRALGRQRETSTLVSWRSLIWGATSCVITMAVLQAAVLVDAPRWVAQAAVAGYLLMYVMIVWFSLVWNRDALSPIERASMAFQYGIKLGCAACLIVAMWLHEGNPIYALPAFFVVIGLGVFAHGLIYWGRFYLIGLSFYVVAVLMPLVPVPYWPSVYGLYVGLFQIFAGLHLRRVHQKATN